MDLGELTEREALLWLAGLLEGEGSFVMGQDTYIKVDGTRSWRYKVYLKMTDLDTVLRAQTVAGVGSVTEASTSKKPKHHKRAWHLQVQANQEALDLMRRVLPFMGERRSIRIREILEHGKTEGFH